jgi:hypothetical protein
MPARAARRHQARFAVSIMLRFALVIAGVMNVATASAHECRAVGNQFLRGGYTGDCDEVTERPEGRGEAKGIDTYVGSFVKGRPEGSGTYTWANGARLAGTFKQGRAHGAGVFTSTHGVRYEGEFVDGRLDGMKPADCPVTPGPISCGK